ncbi:hypothetical protein VIM7927_00275 [Vibrio mangrovi]|uniref:Uncharacterized protein n=1 Tax=Vibrio mangrovi TaxID=474394 RepID=A0A1Y6ISK3_9VIBR|nr:hypothetical protein [Vibrio mangrovi]MDW6004150.1 hypothetical protein [Vibrio mangrovi]SMR99053.1 hypothetical protein VIM7927_00275 [Vibrio mangrovi]
MKIINARLRGSDVLYSIQIKDGIFQAIQPQGGISHETADIDAMGKFVVLLLLNLTSIWMRF